MAEEAGVDLWVLSDLCTPWCLHVAATLQLVDHLAAGPLPIADLARLADADADALQRLMRHLASKGVFVEPEPGSFALNAAAEALRRGDAGPNPGLDLDSIGGRMAHAWGGLLQAVRTGQPAYASIFGRPFWEDLDAHPAVAASFDALMGPAGHGAPDPDVLLNPADWDAVHQVVDVGGGTGSLLAAILRARPGVRGTLVDLPRTVARSDAIFQAAGVAERATAVGQSFFDPLPAGADLYLLKNVLGDWPDRAAEALLRRCAEAARPAGRLVVLGGVSPDDAAGGANPELLMLVLVGGRDRALTEFRALAAVAGLHVRAAGRLPSGRHAVECVPS